MLYSKLGSIPKPETDGTEGWIEVPEPPVAPEGMEVVWWFPPGWVVRPPMPVKDGFVYNWSQSKGRWMEAEILPVVEAMSADDTVVGASFADTIIIGMGADTVVGA